MTTIMNEGDLLLQAINPRFVPLDESGLTDDQQTNISNMLALTSNGVLAVAEKTTFKTWWNGVVAEYDVLNEQANLYGLNSTLRTNYTNSYNTLSAQVTPLLSNMGVDSIVDNDIFTTNIYNYYEDRQSLIADRTNYYIANPYGGRGINVCHPRYSTFEEASLPPLSLSNMTAAQETSGYYGTKSLKLTVTGTNSSCFLGSSATDYNMKIEPNKKWLVSFSLKSSVANRIVQVHIRTSDGAYTIATVTASAVANTQERKTVTIDLSTNSSTRCVLRFDCDDAATSGSIWLDGIMMEEKIGDTTVPSAYSEPPNFLKTYLGDLNATYGSTWGNNITSQPSDDALYNSLITTNANLVPAVRNWSRGTNIALNEYDIIATDETSLSITTGTGVTRTASISLAGKLTQNTSYTLSFKARNTSGSNQTIDFDLYPDTLPQQSFVIPNGNSLHQVTWSSSHADILSASLRLIAANSVNGVRIFDIQFEFGTVRTPYTPYRYDLLSRNSKLTTTNYQDFLDPNTITKIAYGSNESGGATTPTKTVSFSFDSDGQPIVAHLSGMAWSTKNAIGTYSNMTMTFKKEATTLLNKVVCQMPANPSSEYWIFTSHMSVYIPSPGTSSQTYELTLTDYHSISSGGASGVGYPSIELIAFKR
jgi:hypothetical protein